MYLYLFMSTAWKFICTVCSTVKFPKGNGSTEVTNGYKRFGFPNFGGGIEGRHILIIAMSEHHVDYMNRKGGHSVIMQGDLFTDVYIR